MIKLFASDLDGTLLNEYHTTDEVILGAIDKVLEANRFFTVATGRDMHKFSRENGFGNRPIYTIAMNGALILDTTGEPLFSKAIDQGFVSELIEEFPHTAFVFICQGKTLMRGSEDSLVNHFKGLTKEMEIDSRNVMVKKIVDELTAGFEFNVANQDILAEEVLKINVRLTDHDTKHRLNAFLERHADKIVNAPYEDNFYEITHKSVNKGNAVKYLASHLGLKHHEVAVYGDGGNDLEMLSMFENSYATATAVAEAKQLASQTIGHNKDHAVPKHIMATLEGEISY